MFLIFKMRQNAYGILKNLRGDIPDHAQSPNAIISDQISSNLINTKSALRISGVPFCPSLSQKPL